MLMPLATVVQLSRNHIAGVTWAPKSYILIGEKGFLGGLTNEGFPFVAGDGTHTHQSLNKPIPHVLVIKTMEFQWLSDGMVDIPNHLCH